MTAAKRTESGQGTAGSAAPPAEATGHPLLVLLGPPGAGVSTVAALIAEAWGAPLLDTDRMVAEAAGLARPSDGRECHGRGDDASGATVVNPIVELGEQRFRALEADAVRTALNADGAVVALGSGALGATPQDTAHDAARAALATAREAGARVVHLDASLAKVTERMGLRGPQPIGLGAPRAMLLKFAQLRDPLYRDAANQTIDTDRLTAQEVAQAVRAYVAQ